MNGLHPGVTGRAPLISDGPYLPAKAVCARYGISDRTLDRWLENDSLNFPLPLLINGRRYFSEGDLQAFERARVTRKTEAA